MADAAGAAGRAAAVQLLESEEKAKQHASEREWQEQKNAGMKETIVQYKEQVVTLQQALRTQAEDSQHALEYAGESADQAVKLAEEIIERDQVFELERSVLAKRIEQGQSAIQRLERELSVSQEAVERGTLNGEAQAQQEEAVDGVRSKLNAMKVIGLHKKCVALGMDLEQVDGVMEADDPKPLLVELMLVYHKEKAEAAYMSALSKALHNI